MKKMNMTGVSVVVITFNEEKNIRECLDSLAAQDYPEEKYEVIVVDASTDKTPELVKEYERKYRRKSQERFSKENGRYTLTDGKNTTNGAFKEKVEVEKRQAGLQDKGHGTIPGREDENDCRGEPERFLIRLIKSEKGFSRQKNRGLRESRFEIVAFTDADCIIPANWLKGIDEVFSDKQLAAAGGNAYLPPGGSRFGFLSACVGHPAGGALGFDANLGRRDKCGAAFVAGCNSAFRKEALKAVGGFNPAFQGGGEDVDVSRTLRAKGYKIAYDPELSVYHKPRPNLGSFFKWNISVGVTKYNLWKPSFWKILAEPASPLWILAAVGLLIWAGSVSLWAFFGAGLRIWGAYLSLLYAGAKPYRMLWKKRKHLGVKSWETIFFVPLLTYVRQLGIFLGEWKSK